MGRAALFLTIGVAVATAGSFSYSSHGQSSPAATGVIAALAARPAGTAERAALYSAAARAGVDELETLLSQAAALRDKSTRAFALDALLTRHSELDAGGAIAAAERLELPPASIAALYHAWLKSAPTAALDALAELDDADARAVASGLIALIGDDELLVNRVVAVFPPTVADSLVAQSLARVAQDSPAEAFARAKEIFDRDARENAMRGVLYTWAQRDPLAALDEIDALADPATRSSMRAVVVAQLAQRDPAAALRYFDTLDAAAQRETYNTGFWQQLAATAPELVLERIGTLPAEVRQFAELTALQMLAQRDPDAAMARLAQTPPGPARQQLVQSIARTYAERDADEAFAWARALQPPDPTAVAVVVSSIANKDPLRAFDLAAQIGSPMEQMQALHAALSTGTMGDAGMSRPLLERVLALPNNAQRQSLVQAAVTNWAAREPAEAAEWLLANVERTTPDVITQVAAQYARLDRTRAASYADRMPGDARTAWLRGVAGAYAATDPRGAFDWVEQFRGRPEYDDTAFAVLQSGAQYDPAAAARMLESIGRDEYRRSGTSMVAMRWATQDPAAAASWAASQTDPGARQVAISSVTQFWATQDAAAARAWALSQPSGQARDGALMALVNVTARFETLDTSLLSAFSTDQARTGAVQAAAMGMAQRDPDAARQLVEAHVTDQPQRDRMLSMITQMSTMRSRAGLGAGIQYSGPFIGPGMAVPTMGLGMGTMPAGGNQVITIQENSNGITGMRVERGIGPGPVPAPAPAPARTPASPATR